MEKPRRSRSSTKSAKAPDSGYFPILTDAWKNDEN
jgi:hypothetical protein